MTAYPFVQYKCDDFIISGNKDIAILNKNNTCIIKSINVNSQSNEQIIINLYKEKTESGDVIKIPYITQKELPPYENTELIIKTLVVEPDTVIFAYTNALHHVVTLSISYGELTTQTE